MAVYYLAKAQRDLGRSAESCRDMQYLAAHALVPSLGRPGRHHRVDGDIWWPHGDMRRAATAYEAARTEAEQHGVAGERATCQARRALALAFHHAVRDDASGFEAAAELLEQRAGGDSRTTPTSPPS
ncbi:hypothetical protein ACFQ9J_17515 [Streptomyces sp. NPDC056529]|uniref:hypothetical protein n=1 Tax=Streptomyces sp. NPDC056529 TaxID=3345855 RepID=UPI0036BBB09B